jgi:hypothetical protein
MTRLELYTEALRLTVARIGLERAHTAAMATRQPPSRELVELAGDARIAAHSLALKANADVTRQRVEAKRRAERRGR